MMVWVDEPRVERRERGWIIQHQSDVVKVHQIIHLNVKIHLSLS